MTVAVRVIPAFFLEAGIHPAVIPAKAGIHCGLRGIVWIPAFAGMTGGGIFFLR